MRERERLARVKRVERLNLARRIYEYGGGGNRFMNELSERLEYGGHPSRECVQKSRAQLCEMLRWRDGQSLDGPLGGKVDHAEICRMLNALTERFPGVTS